MSTLNLAPAVKYRTTSSLKATGLFLGIMAVICILMVFVTIAFLINLNDSNSSSIGGISSASILFAFVLGICLVREDLRLFIQHGIGRTTTFVAEVVGIVVTAFVLALGGTLLSVILQALAGDSGRVVVADLYQMVYLNDTFGQIMPLADQLTSTFFFFVACCAAQVVGLFISMAYYRLNKVWTVIVSIAVPALLVVGLPALLTALEASGNLTLVVDMTLWMNPWFTIAINAVVTIVFTILTWLLMRRTPIRPAAA